MRRKVLRDEIVDLETYEREREEFRRRVMAEKARRRVHLGQHLTFLFENHETVRYQIQEMLRVERTSKEEAVRHEIETYNELLGGDGEIGATLLIEIDDALQRDVVLRKWLALPRHVYARRADGSLARARFDERQVGEDRLSSVQYLAFEVGDEPPTAIGVDLPGLEIETEIPEETRRALAEDVAA